MRGFCRCSPGRRCSVAFSRRACGGRSTQLPTRRSCSPTLLAVTGKSRHPFRGISATPLDWLFRFRLELVHAAAMRHRRWGLLLRLFRHHCFGRDEQARAETPSGPLSVRTNLVIGADGRHSTVREKAGLVVDDLGARWTCCGCKYESALPRLLRAVNPRSRSRRHRCVRLV